MFFFYNLICSKNILTKLVGYQQSWCQDGIRGWNYFAFHVNCTHFRGALYVHVGANQR